MPLFGRGKYTVVKLKKKEIPEGLWTKCEGCSQPIYNKTLDENFRVCPKCNYHFTYLLNLAVTLNRNKGALALKY